MKSYILLQLLVAAPLTIGFLMTPMFQRKPLVSVKPVFASDTATSNEAIPIKESPLVDRALDSALDFLQDTEGESEEEEDEFALFEIYDDAPEFDPNYDLIAELEEKELVAAANKIPSAGDLNQEKINEAVKRWRKHDNDVGSAQVQVAINHEKVKYLTAHLLRNKKDNSAKRGLVAIVNQRRKFLNYLYKHDINKAKEMIDELGIRFRPPGQQWDKVAKYAAYKNTKTPKNKLNKK